MKFLKNVAVQALGTMGAQFIPILLSPIILRLYAPEAFGEFGVAITVATFCGIMATLKMEHGVIQASTEAEAARTYWSVLYVSLSLSTALSLLTCLILAWVSPHLLSFWSMVLVPMQAAAMVMMRLKSYYVLKIEAYPIQARTRIIQSALGAGLTILMGLLYANAITLQLALLLAVSLTLLQLPAPRGRRFSWRSMAFVLKKHRKFLYFSLVGDTMNTLTVLAPQFLFAQVFGLAAGGQMAQTNRILMTPSKLVGGAIMEVFYRTALADKSGKGDQSLMFRYLSTALLNAVVGIPLFVTLYVFAEDIVPFVFGPEWVELGIYIKTLAAAICVLFIFGPLANMHYVLGTQVIDMIANIVSLTGIYFAITLADNHIIALQNMSWVIITITLANNLMILGMILRQRKPTRGQPT